MDERDRDLKVNAADIEQLRGPIYKEDEVSDKHQTWATWKPWLGHCLEELTGWRKKTDYTEESSKCFNTLSS